MGAGMQEGQEALVPFRPDGLNGNQWHPASGPGRLGATQWRTKEAIATALDMPAL